MWPTLTHAVLLQSLGDLPDEELDNVAALCVATAVLTGRSRLLRRRRLWRLRRLRRRRARRLLLRRRRRRRRWLLLWRARCRRGRHHLLCGRARLAASLRR